MIIKAAIVEDDISAYQNIDGMLKRYSSETGREIQTHYFSDGRSFLKNLRPDFDLVFMDINMPDMNGLEVARKMRKVDGKIFLIFVTDLAQYAIKGYEVDAIDFIIKPVKYEHLRQKLNRICSTLSEYKEEHKVLIRTENGNVILSTSDIFYVEIINHRLYYHAKSGTFDAYGSLSDVEKSFPTSFARCNHCYLVNLEYVTSVDKFTVTVGQDKLMISHPKKKEFQMALTKYLGDHE